MTVCNMSIEAGARAGMIAPDDDDVRSTCRGRESRAQGATWDAAVARWRDAADRRGRRLRSHGHARRDALEPMITYGTNPGMGIADHAPVPVPTARSERARALEKALAYMGLEPGEPLLGQTIDVVFIGSCTNARISDLRAAAQRAATAARSRAGVRVLVVPGSQAVKRAGRGRGARPHLPRRRRRVARAGLLDVHRDERRPARARASTRSARSNRNFEGRQGKGGRTFLASPLTAAAAAVTGASPTSATLL